jgi:hypothetical protein
MKTLSILLLLIATNLFAAEWNQTDKNLYKGYLALQLADTLQTKNMITCQRNYTCPNLAEANPVLGPYPTTSQLLTTKFVSNMVVYTFLDRYSNDRTRRAALIGLIVVSAFIVSENSSNGLSFKIKI